MQVTISLLPVSLSLVHIPRSRLDSLSSPILRQLLHPTPPGFLNITCNEIELSVFAESAMVRDFEPVARRDRRRRRMRERAGEGEGEGSGKGARKGKGKEYEPVEISSERWSVLQIDSHSDQIDNSGTRVYDLSAPLAAAGISILYQSSYMSDFIFVKEARLQEAMDLFASAGFDVYTAADEDSEEGPIRDPSHSPSISPSPSPSPLPPQTTTTTPATDPQPPKKPKSHSPTSGEVCILHPDLACVGLSEELGVDHWGLKIVKLVAFPDLIPASPTRTRGSASACNSMSGSRMGSRSRSGSYASSSVKNKTKRKTKIDAEDQDQETAGSSSSSSPYSSGSSSLTSMSSSSSSSEDEDDDGYFSHSPRRNISAASLSTTTTTAGSTQTPILSSPPLATREGRAPARSQDSHSHSPSQKSTHSPSQKSHSQKPHPAQPQPRTPFFSFTRTPEGSSLTADVHVLAMLFPRGERHMVICSGELDVADSLREGGGGWGEGGGGGQFGEGEEDWENEDVVQEDGEDEDGEEEEGASRSLKCLQIDLRRFGLDKHGLVNRFSRVLEENGINHMYSSTFKTANLLVDKRHARRAQSLLRGC